MSTALSCMYHDRTKCTFLSSLSHQADILIVYSLAPLQPLAINGRNRIFTNGPLVHQQVTSVLPPAASLQSLSPLTGPVADQPANSDGEEREKLKADIQQLKNELQKSKETIARLQKSEEQMRER